MTILNLHGHLLSIFHSLSFFNVCSFNSTQQNLYPDAAAVASSLWNVIWELLEKKNLLTHHWKVWLYDWLIANNFFNTI